MTAGRKVLLVGPGFRFLSGLSVHTCCLANSLADTHDVSLLMLDRLVPRRFYPGSARVGHDLTALRYDSRIKTAGTIDWYWGTSIFSLSDRIRALAPDIIVLQWWTAATLHTYLLIAWIARRLGISVIVEFHELQDTGEAGVPFLAAYCRTFLRRLVRVVSGAIFHNEHDRQLISSTLGARFVERLPSRIAPLGPYPHLKKSIAVHERSETISGLHRPAKVLFFGLIRPYKGVEDLVAAIDLLTEEQVRRLDIDIVGETWHNWTVPAEAIAASRHRDRISFVNRYVSDAEATEYFDDADVLVLPYRRCSASGPLQAAMSIGLPVVLYAVGGLIEAVADYPGAVLVPPGDIEGLGRAIMDVATGGRRRSVAPSYTWDPLRNAIDAFPMADAR
ncbi:glycosyltransferase [Mycobacterium sp. PDNC021]|uniref:glycosyltransferase n=1 Tax=Mycobacterium sp. PDNC021 TaxID=3391399 RepID=UPI003AAC02E9